MTILAYDGERLRKRFATRRYWNWRRLVVCASIAYATVIGVRQFIAYGQMQTRMRQVDQRIAQLHLENDELKQQIAFAKSPQYVRQAASNKLGLVPRGDIPFQPLP